MSRDPARQVLREFDPEGREGDLACGAVVTNLCVSARAFGFEAEVSWRPAEGVAADVTLMPAAEAPDEAAGERLRALRRRAMNRSRYRADPVPGSVVEGLQATAKRLGFTLAVLTDRAGIERVAALAARAGVMKMMHEPTQAELHSLMRTAPGPPPGSGTAWTWSCSSPRRRRRGPPRSPRIRARSARRHRCGWPRGSPAAIDEVPLRSAPALCLLQADSLEAETFLRGGACFEEIALDVTQAGLAMALHSALIEVGLSHPGPMHPSVPADWHAGIAEMRRELLAAFGAEPQAVPVAFFRLGSPTREPERKSLRRTPRQAAARRPTTTGR